MEDDEESDEEVENFREGLVAVKLSKDFKKKIHTPWTKALIVKVFYLKEDFEATLKRGPWFIREHFLSIKPWEPNFRPELTNVTSVIDMDKPLVTAVLIGRFEQPVCYEGIQKLCFSCGRMGHRKASCPYMVHPVLPVKEVKKGATENDRDVEGQSCDMPVPNESAMGMEPSRIVHGNVSKEVQERTYGPWTIVVRRKNLPKNQRSGGAHVALDNGRLRQE
nr:hypothetical protein CFP56_27427 [Quercus suber]